MSSYEYEFDNTSRLPVCWLVYYYKGAIKIKKGRMGRNFYPDNEYLWHTGVPRKAMQVSSKGKVLCWNETDVPLAKQMIYEHYVKKVDEVRDRAVAALDNIKKMVESEEIQTE